MKTYKVDATKKILRVDSIERSTGGTAFTEVKFFRYLARPSGLLLKLTDRSAEFSATPGGPAMIVVDSEVKTPDPVHPHFQIEATEALMLWHETSDLDLEYAVFSATK